MTLGFDSIPAFVAEVAGNFGEVWQASGRQLLVTVKNGRKDVMYVQLEAAQDGDFYRVNSAFPVRQQDYEERHHMKKLWLESEPRAKASGEPSAFVVERANKASGIDPNATTQSKSSVANPDANSTHSSSADATNPDASFSRREVAGSLHPKDAKAALNIAEAKVACPLPAMRSGGNGLAVLPTASIRVAHESLREALALNNLDEALAPVQHRNRRYA